ncbi:MAG: ABC transporter permease [Syntrophorhabdaceae bacterium]|nr:ABC transporter permease [Syntrophorhabdaceae bacterium]
MRLKGIVKKEFIHIKRDPLSLAMAFLLPAILLFIYGYAVTFDVENIETVVCDRDKSSLSRELIEGFSKSGYFTIISYTESYNDVDGYIDRGDAKAGIIIPDDFSKTIRKGGLPSVEIIIDGSNSNIATIALGYVSAIEERYTRRLYPLSKEGPLIQVKTRIWYNREMRSRNFIIPGLIAVIMAVIVALLTSLTVSKEWDRGSMEQLLSTPVKPSELVLGKLIPYFIIGFADTVFAVLMSTFLFGVPLKGDPVLLFLLSSIFLFGGLSFGILISIVAKNQTIASQIAMLTTFLPAFLLSGFIFSISNMPKILQIFTLAIPARYFVTILKGIFLKGVTIEDLLWETALLSLYGLIVFFLAVKKLKKWIG